MKIYQGAFTEHNTPNCETKDCKNKAIGLISDKWRCGNCIALYSKRLQDAEEQLFIKE